MRRLLLASVLALTVAAASAVGATTTQTVIYQAFDASGKAAIKVTSTKPGYCYSGSLVANRNDAWRCFIGNVIHDPCFSSSKAKGVVLCPRQPWKQSGIKITLTKKLPTALGNKAPPSTKGLPWGIETVSGKKCTLTSGASLVLQGKRANYICKKSKNWLWGAPSRKSQPWKIFSAPITAKSLTHKVKIKTAWF